MRTGAGDARVPGAHRRYRDRRHGGEPFEPDHAAVVLRRNRSRHRAELVTDGGAALKEQLEAVTGERIAALEAVQPERAKGRKSGLDGGRSPVRERDASESRERAPEPEPEPEPARVPKGTERDMAL